MEQDLESEVESDDFSRKVASCLGRPVEVLMGDVVSDPKDDPNASKAANGKEKTPEAGQKKVDFVPPLAQPVNCRLTETTLTLQPAR